MWIYDPNAPSAVGAKVVVGGGEQRPRINSLTPTTLAAFVS